MDALLKQQSRWWWWPKTPAQHCIYIYTDKRIVYLIIAAVYISS